MSNFNKSIERKKSYYEKSIPERVKTVRETFSNYYSLFSFCQEIGKLFDAETTKSTNNTFVICLEFVNVLRSFSTQDIINTINEIYPEKCDFKTIVEIFLCERSKQKFKSILKICIKSSEELLIGMNEDLLNKIFALFLCKKIYEDLFARDNRQALAEIFYSTIKNVRITIIKNGLICLSKFEMITKDPKILIDTIEEEYFPKRERKEGEFPTLENKTQTFSDNGATDPVRDKLIENCKKMYKDIRF